jgi:hypothetical protein
MDVLAKKLSSEKAKLYVVTSLSNPIRYRSRYSLYDGFKKRTEDAGAILYTAELAYGNRPFYLAGERVINVRTNSELWHKENLLNLAISRLPPDWEYVAWIDADVGFARPDWVCETIHQLQHYDMIQMFSVAQDLLPNHEVLQKHNGFIYSYLNGLPSNNTYGGWHPGFAWAARREALNNVGGLIDYGILGAADRNMACGLLGRIFDTMPDEYVNIDTGYKRKLLAWQDRAERYIKRNIGYLPGLILHYWHGKKEDRRYRDRWRILVNNMYDPDLDLKYDTQGIHQLTDRNYKLRDDIRRYFRSRNEDSIDV